VTALQEGCHPERSVLGEVKDLNLANLRFFTVAKNAAVQNDEAFVIRKDCEFIQVCHPERSEAYYRE
jgi:hypothetical protein